MDSNLKELNNCTSLNDFFHELPNNSYLSISCMHINIRSIIKNFTKLQQIIHNCIIPLDVIVITEAGISSNIVQLYNLSGYTMYPQLRSNKRGGGIIVYIRSHFKFTPIQHSTWTFENLTGILKVNSDQEVVVCAVYRPPRNNKHVFVNELDKYVAKYSTKQNLLLVGDTNIDLKRIDSLRHSFLETLSGHGLMCGISEYTRIEKKLNKITKSCIDHFFVRFPTLRPYTAVLDVTLADHRAIVLACIDDTMRLRQPRSIQGVPKQVVDFEVLHKELKKVKWLQTSNMTSPTDVFNFIRSSFQNATAASTSTQTNNYKKSTYKFKAPWIDDNVTRLCDKRNCLFKSWRKNPFDFKLRLEYNKTRNKLHKLLETRRNNYYMKEIQANYSNTKKMYQIINNMLGRVTLSIDEAVQRAFERHGLTTKYIVDSFATRFDKAVKDIIPSCSTKLLDTSSRYRPADSSIYFQKATRDEVHKIIKNLNPRKAPGSDNIRVSDIKSIGYEVSGAIADLINCSVKEGTYPDDLKIGCVRPLHKKGKRDDYSNYRPITLLSSIDKIVEKYISEQIQKFYRLNDILYQNQFGFQMGKGTSDLLIKFTDEVNTNLNRKLHVCVLFIDFSRAFDTLDHKQLISKLNDCGIRGPLLNWCSSYLQNRTFQVKINDVSSEPIISTEGTAQGSVLGPLHFLSYVNEMNKYIQYSTCYQFADDTCLVAADKDPNKACDMLQSDFNTLQKWCHDVGLVVNATKTKLLHIKSPYIKSVPLKGITGHDHKCLHSSISCQCSCPPIEVVDSHTYLGLQIDNKFNWYNHIEHVCNKLRQFLANIIILKNRIPFKVKIMLYNSLAESYIQYGLCSYGLTYETYLNKIYDLQIRILKNIVPNKIRRQYGEDPTGLFKHCKVLPVHSQVKFVLLKKLFFVTYNQPQAERPVYTRSVARHQLSCSSVRANNEYGRRTTDYLVPRLINKLPTELRDKLSVKNIKYKLKAHLFTCLQNV